MSSEKQKSNQKSLKSWKQGEETAQEAGSDQELQKIRKDKVVYVHWFY